MAAKQRQHQPTAEDVGVIWDEACEQAVLGAILCERDVLAAVAKILSAEDFERAWHRFVFQLMLDLWGKREPCDIVTVASEIWRRLKAMDRADRLALNEPAAIEGYLGECIVNCPVVAHAEWYARRVLDMADRRRLQAVAQATVDGVYRLDSDLGVVADEAAAGLQSARHMPPEGCYAFIGDIADDASFQPLPRLRLGGEFSMLDTLIGGFEDGQMIVVAARPSVGKSAIVLQWLYGIASQQQRPVGLISLEMPKRDLVNRVMAMAAQVDMHAIRGGVTITPEQHRRVRAVREALATLPLALDDDPVTTLPSVLARARAIASQERVALLGIDYLQLITVPGKQESRTQEVSKISAAIKQLARDLGIPVVILAQLNRSVELRPDAEPRLSDLRDSGSIEQDADVVVLLHRVNEQTGHVKAKVEKNRNGPTGWVDLTFDKPTASFRARAKEMATR